jgi:hypothetical protein
MPTYFIKEFSRALRYYRVEADSPEAAYRLVDDYTGDEARVTRTAWTHDEHEIHDILDEHCHPLADEAWGPLDGEEAREPLR